LPFGKENIILRIRQLITCIIALCFVSARTTTEVTLQQI
jgi:hypothetical protein